MDGNEQIARLKSLLDDWFVVCKSASDHGDICTRFKGRLLEFMDNVAKDVSGGRASPLDFKPIAGAEPIGAVLPPRGLIGPITAETGERLMLLLVEVSNGVVDEAIHEALRKHCERRFGCATLDKLNESMGQQLVRDFENVKAGKHSLEYDEDGCLTLTNWNG
jgi:hypothetical protein